MAQELVLGVDPDTRNTGWALATKHKLIAVGVARGDGTLESMFNAVHCIPPVRDIDLIVVEGQEIHHGGKAPPHDIIKLAQFAGAIGAALMGVFCCSLVIPKPSEWKKQVPKPIHQRRSYTAYGLRCDEAAGYCYPIADEAMRAVSGAYLLNQSDWKHVGDAIGLARWGADRA